MSVEKIGYKQVTAAPAVVKATPAGFFGCLCVVAGTVTVRDGTVGGAILFTKTMAVGESLDFGTVGISCTGIYCDPGAGTFNIHFT